MNSNSRHYLNLIFPFYKVKIALVTCCLPSGASGMGEGTVFSIPFKFRKTQDIFGWRHLFLSSRVMCITMGQLKCFIKESESEGRDDKMQ